MQKKSYGIARVSTGKQVKFGASLDMQNATIHRMANANEDTVEHIFVDEGVSGGETIKRVEYSKLKELIRAGMVNNIYTYHMSRYGRNFEELQQFWKLCEKNNVMIFHDQDHFDYRGTMGKFMRNIMGTMAEFIKDTASDTTASTLQSMKHGKRKYSITPYGYRVINERKDEEGKVVYKGDLELCPTESEVVKGMISALAAGISLSRIADGLNQRGIKPRRGKQWAHSQVASVISTFTSLQEK
jgi:site-specific DNA recombinase